MTATIVKLDAFLLQHVLDRLDPYAQRLYEVGGSVMIVAELTAVERTVPIQADPDDKRVGQVKLRMTECEVASRAHEQHIRNVQHAMYRIRTRSGTLDEVLAGQAANEVKLADAVLLDGAHEAAND